MASTSSIIRQSLGKIVQHAPAVGAKMWCLCVFSILFFSHYEASALCVRRVHSLNKHCVAHPTRSKFSKIFFEQLYTGWTVVVDLCCGFSPWRQMAPHQSAKFRTTFFGQFCTSLRMDSVANYASIWTLFSTSVTGPHVLCNALNISQIRL